LSAEVYIANFDGDLYGKKLNIRVYKKIREVMKFDSPQALHKQIECDLEVMKL